MEPTELETTENQYWVDQNSALERLKKNKDFQDVILNGYFVNKAINGVSMLSVESVKAGGKRGDIMEDLVAISNLQYHFAMIANLGAIAEDDLITEAFSSAE